VAAKQYVPHGFGCLDELTINLPMCNTSLSIPERVSNFLAQLTTTEKIGLTGSFNGDLCSDIDAGVPRLNIPNVSQRSWALIFHHWQTCIFLTLTLMLQVTQLIEITGTVSSSCYVDEDGASFCPTVFPAPLALAASFSRSLWHTKGAVTGIEARAFNK
jgi:hypothetical protein